VGVNKKITAERGRIWIGSFPVSLIWCGVKWRKIAEDKTAVIYCNDEIKRELHMKITPVK